LQCVFISQTGISTRNLKMLTIDGSKSCAKNKCNTQITPPKRYKRPSRGANRPLDVAVTVIINAYPNWSLIWWQVIPELNAFHRISSMTIITVYSLVLSTLCLPLLLIPTLVAQIGVYLAYCSICLQRRLFLHSKHRTSISDSAYSKPSVWHNSSRMKCSKSCWLSECTTNLACSEFTTCPWYETCFRTD
jgi:hypothetical protein